MKLHRKIARLLGYELTRRIKHPNLNAHIHNLIKHYDINLVLDVGANNGQFAQMLRAEGFDGLIHSFEPVSETYKKLQQASSADANWQVHQLALGDSCGTADVNVTEGSEFSSLLNPNAFGEREFNAIKVAYTEEVSISMVDKFIEEQLESPGDYRILLKMDTQGFDLKVFAGARKYMAQICCLLSEISFLQIYDEMPDYKGSLTVFEEQGFRVSGLFPVTRRKDLSLIEMDCMMINTRRAANQY
jgi:FkbM family methyltransferase